MEKNLNYPFNIFLNFVIFFAIPSWVFDTDLITALTEEITCGFPSAQHALAHSVSQYSDSEAEVWHICSKHLWHLQCLIKMTFVFSGFLRLSKYYNEFRSFQAKYLNPCSCLQQMSSEAVLTTSLIFGSLIETVSLQVLLNFLFPCSFFPPHYPLFSIQELRATSKPCPDFYGPLFFSCEGGPQEMQANPSVALCLPQVTGTNTDLCAAAAPACDSDPQVCSSPRRSSSLSFLSFLWKHRYGDFYTEVFSFAWAHQDERMMPLTLRQLLQTQPFHL